MIFADMGVTAIPIAAIAGFLLLILFDLLRSRPKSPNQSLSSLRDVATVRAGPSYYLVHLGALLAMAWIQWGILGHLGPGQITVRNGIISALFTFVGFIAPMALAQQQRYGLKLSDSLYDCLRFLCVTILMGALIGGLAGS